LREKLKQELDRRAQEKKIKEAQAKTAFVSPAIPEMSNFQKWLVRIGIKKPDKPKLRDLADIDDVFLAELAEKRKANPKRGSVPITSRSLRAVFTDLFFPSYRKAD